MISVLGLPLSVIIITTIIIIIITIFTFQISFMSQIQRFFSHSVFPYLKFHYFVIVSYWTLFFILNCNILA